MPKKRRECLSVAQEIDSLEEKLSQCRQSLEEVDFKLQREELTPEGRKSLEKEKSLLTTKVENYGYINLPFLLEKVIPLQDMEDKKRGHALTIGKHNFMPRDRDRRSSEEKELQALRHENRKNAALSVVLVLLVVVIYTCWTM